MQRPLFLWRQWLISIPMDNHDDFPDDQAVPAALARGVEVVRAFVKTLPDAPGVYRMLNEKGDVLYVGKAKSLKKRVANYTQVARLSHRIQRMVAETSEMMVVRTHTEAEALLLESNLIKKLKPRYNVLLRDDKSFPYILITDDHEFPQVIKHRGSRSRKGHYFGPFASAGAVNRTIAVLQRAFMLRNCSDSVFAQRTRPCLQFHIKRCTAPCVNMVSREDYAKQVEQARAYLTGKSREIQEQMAAAMQAASDRMDYEEAAKFRDRLRALTSLQTRQDINFDGIGDVDAIALVMREGRSCVQVFFFRGGQNFGNRAYFPRHERDEEPETILAAFIAQFYESKPIPPHILISHNIPDADVIEDALNSRPNVERKTSIACPQRGERRRLIDFVANNARDALDRHLLERAGDAQLLDGVAELFGLDERPVRIEIYDNSHISGTDMVGAMVVAGPEGFMKSAYRKFNIRDASASDDYGMMQEVMSRRFRKAQEEGNGPGSEDWPDLLLIDGGLGQLNAVMETLADMGISEELNVVSIAKGPDRNAGREKFFMPGREMFQLPVNNATLHYLQRLRDEAHRFAIGAHRTRRAKHIGASPLDDVPGIGAKRKKALLLHFGSAQDVVRAGIADLEKVEGISHAVAERIYAYFHETDS